MPGTLDTLRSSTSVPDKNKRRSVNRSRRKVKNGAVSRKISKLRSEGKKQSQAVAIAISMKKRGEI